MNTHRIFVATGNPGKAREVRQLLPSVEVFTLADQPLDMPPEDGPTFEAIARVKAEFACERLSVPVLADDSGLEVDALGGRPGIRSARFVEGTDEDRYLALLREMEGEPHREARFVCAMALARPGAPTLVVRGTCEGRIAENPRGQGGFGYDPVFLLPDGRAMAELGGEAKNRVSHRGAALQALKPALDALF